MKIKFNSGKGAILCDKCRVIFASGFDKIKWDALIYLQQAEKEWYCAECDYAAFMKQSEKLIEAIDDIRKAQRNDNTKKTNS